MSKCYSRQARCNSTQNSGPQVPPFSDDQGTRLFSWEMDRSCPSLLPRPFAHVPPQNPIAERYFENASLIAFGRFPLTR